MSKRILIVGYGQIGKALREIEEDAENRVAWLDIDTSMTPQEFDVMHICIPFVNMNDFVDICEDYITRYKSELVVIHSTVAPGTTDMLSLKTKQDIIFSPVIGKHPELKKSILTFTKCIAGHTIHMIEMACDHLCSIGINSYIFDSTEELEFTKLLSTTKYGIDIAWVTYINKICKENGYEVENINTAWTDIYNEGYQKLGYNEYTRPVLNPNDNGIGGHCVWENAEILTDYIPFKDNWLDHVFKLGKENDNRTND